MNFKFTLTFLSILGVLFSSCSKEHTIAENPAASNSKYPFLFSSGDSLYMSWITETDDHSFSLNYARYNNKTWSQPHTIARDSSWFVNWADFPSLIANKKGPLAAHWLNKKSGGTYAYDVNISVFNSEKKWSPSFTPHFDSTATEHGFVSMIPWDNHTFLAVWLDGRQTANRSDADYYNLKYAMALRGALIGTDGKVQKRFLIDEAVCDCCQTSLVKTKNGAIVAYRNRTDEEIRDIYISRFDGASWSNPKTVYRDRWEIGACPVNGPVISANDGMLVVAWYTAATNPTIKAAISTDNGNTFSEPVVLNTDRAIGRVDAEVFDDQAYVSWIEDDDNALLRMASINKSGRILSRKTISEIDGSRQTGFPQMERHGNDLIFAWTTTDSLSSSVKTKKVSIF